MVEVLNRILRTKYCLQYLVRNAVKAKLTSNFQKKKKIKASFIGFWNFFYIDTNLHKNKFQVLFYLNTFKLI